jgi:hypothetical protein
VALIRMLWMCDKADTEPAERARPRSSARDLLPASSPGESMQAPFFCAFKALTIYDGIRGGSLVRWFATRRIEGAAEALEVLSSLNKSR